VPLTYRKQKLTGWGQYLTSRAEVARPERRLEVSDALIRPSNIDGSVVARGSGLAYGDAALNKGGRVVAMGRLNRFLAFDSTTGQISCEAGVTLGEVLDVCIPKGWFLAVTPGTSRATVAGCLACDIHGKNHHVSGSFSEHVVSTNILTGNGNIVTCGPNLQEDLFWATAGGMGLTGIILDVTLQLRPVETAYVVAKNIVTRDLEETLQQIEALSSSYSVAWVDGVARGSRLGRGIIMLGEHARITDIPADQRTNLLNLRKRRARSLPFGLPIGMLGRPLALILNELIYRSAGKKTALSHVVDAYQYFYALDTIDNWYRLYGHRGFLEYQAVLPSPHALGAIRQMLEILHQTGCVSFFTSVKQLGASSRGHLSFPAPGYAFSFDVWAGDDNILSVLNRCDKITIDAGGRVYLAKDARLSAESFRSMYSRCDDWLAIARRYDPSGIFASDMSRRLGLSS